jgi:sulfoxide reductase catalytic subunit YedY
MAAGQSPQPDLLQTQLSLADDRVRLSHWTPPQCGVIPHVRVGKWWFNVFWAIPLGAALLVVGIAIGQELRGIPAVERFIARYPGIVTSAPVDYSGFPLWLRWQHFLNLFFMMFIIRAGIQILADHPRLYLKRDSTPVWTVLQPSGGPLDPLSRALLVPALRVHPCHDGLHHRPAA